MDHDRESRKSPQQQHPVDKAQMQMEVDLGPSRSQDILHPPSQPELGNLHARNRDIYIDNVAPMEVNPSTNAPL